MKNSRKNPASALIISFFIMAILILVGISISGIVFRDIGVVRTALNGLSSAYAAEGMSEVGLKMLKDHLPGYEVSDYSLKLSNEVTGDLKITARGEQLPCQINTDDPEWRTLALNESITIPLFADNGSTPPEKLSDFKVEYYLPDNDTPDGDVLRWKILGLNSDKKTEAISDYLPGSGSKDVPAILDSTDTAKYYAYVDASHYVFYDTYQITTFLNDHDYNYLILSNVVQLSESIGSRQSSEDKESNSINFQLTSTSTSTSPTSKPVCEYVQLDSSSDDADVRKSIKTIVKEGENLPVFDFALYQSKPE